MLQNHKKERLSNLLTIMNVPRKHIECMDISWLSRNLAARNAKHELFEEAVEIIKELMKDTSE